MRAHDEGREGELWRRHRRPYPIWPTLIWSTLIWPTLIWSGKPDAIFTCVASHVLLHGCCEVTKPIAGGQTLMQMPPDCAPPQITTVVACEQGSVTRHAQSQDMLSHDTGIQAGDIINRWSSSDPRHGEWDVQSAGQALRQGYDRITTRSTCARLGGEAGQCGAGRSPPSHHLGGGGDHRHLERQRAQ